MINLKYNDGKIQGTWKFIYLLSEDIIFCSIKRLQDTNRPKMWRSIDSKRD